jgi:catechol 2,3-dioxygenase-like lactoylglutathione lyase family enzyme
LWKDVFSPMEPIMTRSLSLLLPLAALLFSPERQLWAQEQQDSTVFLAFGVTFWVRDVRTSAEFYRDSLGLPLGHYLIGHAQETTNLQPSDPEPYSAQFKVGNQRLYLQLADGPVHASGARYAFTVLDPASYSIRLRKRGVRIQVILGDSTSAVWFSVVDPDGRRLEFSGPPRPR